jgi:CHAT domain-containing protein
VGRAQQLGHTGYEEVLRSRGLVARVDAAERRLGRRGDAEAHAASTSLTAAQRRVARLAGERPPRGASEPERTRWQRRFAEASADAARLSDEVLRGLREVSADLVTVEPDLAVVRAALRPGEALVEFLRTGDAYVAWLVRAEGEVARADLGSAAAIEEAAADFVELSADDATRLDDAEWRAAGRRLRDRLFAPFEDGLGEAGRRLYVVPDAALAAVPFAALPGTKEGTFLLDERVVVHLSSGADLVLDEPSASRGTGALLLGGVDYDVRVGDEAGAPPSGAAAVPAAGLAFLPLPGSKGEVAGLAKRLAPDAVLLEGAAATERALLAAAPRRRLLHLATHGFVRTDLLSALRPRKDEARWLGAGLEAQLTGYDPMVLTGLALAGANPRAGGGGDDGILTALEASYLDLDGCDLVVLSACDTAGGVSVSGEGVLGLVRGFRTAGARGVVASLWPVGDAAVPVLMDGFYARLAAEEEPLPPAEALREACRALRDSIEAAGKRPFARPRDWAAFVAFGR